MTIKIEVVILLIMTIAEVLYQVIKLKKEIKEWKEKEAYYERKTRTDKMHIF